ncbi:hypothetical protein [Chromobacterium haemolyticum]|uniref:hypothetical protein n=1 Tax=Chromobacterium haemolyticum TaxID=394935 RepID=UPI00307D44A0
MTELEKQLFDALKHISGAIERQLELIAERAPGQFLDKKPVVQALRSHARKADAAIAAAEAAANSAAPAVPEAIDLLRTMEWLYKPYDDYSHAQAGYYCPECEEMRESGHRDDCKLRALLAAAPPATVKDSLIVQQAQAQVEQQVPAIDATQIVEQIAQQWDECDYDGIDIGAAIRAAGTRLVAETKGGE